MNTTESLQRLEETTNQYLEELNGLTFEQLRRQPSENEWSLGQMYLHLIHTAQRMQIGSIEKCRSQAEESAVAEGEKTEIGAKIFSHGSFPAERIQVPASPYYTPEQPLSKEQIADGLHAVLQKMKEIEPTLDAIPSAYTALHPRFGGLHAKEWFTLVEMHYRHHLHQLERLKQFLGRAEG
ncbi:DinB family protein [Paenibacillus sp. SYP-B3998]|uniref:DinB family protein n=1 Tax=Paenibacillus sp. SYP-B3998 TaxID=2678564 RepID=A0A6G3ZZ12_9BACL|nr:DinB family protein [Paenibacillus sp. SYP-B3998]NEW07372.1 DinB family protein [Paenibacillus sp. SYP-B3998]